MAKTYSYYAPGNRLTAVGGSELDPIVFNDLWIADQDNGWDVVHYYGNNTYHLDCLFYLGDNTTPTYFIDANKLIVFTDQITGFGKNIIYLYANAHIQLGDLVNEENKDVNNGCVIQMNVLSSYNYLLVGSATNTYRYLYGCTIISPNSYSKDVRVNMRDNTRLWHCTFINYTYPWAVGDADIYRLTLIGGTYSIKTFGFQAEVGVPTINDFMATNVGIAIRACLSSSDLIVRRMKATNEKAVAYDMQDKDLNLVDCEFTNWIVHSLGADKLGKTLRKYSVNIHMADKDGVDLEGCLVTCKDKNGNTVFSVQTNASGNIEQQEVTYQEWFQLSSGFHGEEDATCFSPHKFIISKDGYETLEINDITLNELVKWHLELQDPVVECDYPSENDVELGVNYDSGAKTGNFEAPETSEVKKDVGYGANGVEFTGTLETAPIFAGDNIIGQLQKPDSPKGQLQKKTSVEGVLIPQKDELIGTLSKGKMTGKLEKSDEITGEK